MKGKSYKKATLAFDPCRTYLKAIQMLRNKISHYSNILGKTTVRNISRTHNTTFDFSIFMCKNIK